jgi:hypothetical protein
MVFFHDQTGFPCGPTLNETCHYLELAPEHWNGAGTDPFLVWSTGSNSSILVPAYNGFDPTSEEIGRGLANTLAIINQNGVFDASTNNYAAGAAYAYHGGGFQNWYLPNADEAHALASSYAELVTHGFDITQEYWDSNECGSGGAYKIGIDGSGTFYTGGCDGKSSPHPVRPIRAF